MIELNPLYFTMIVLGFSCLAIIIVVLNRISTKKLLVEQQKQADLEIAYQKKITESAVKAQEKERRRLASDLHDDLISKLNIVLLSISGSIDRERIETQLSESISLARKISHALIPPFIDSMSIPELLKNYVSQLSSNYELEFFFNIQKEVELASFYKLQLYRIVQEAITNITKHSHAKTISLSLRMVSTSFQLIIEDDGVGIPNNIIKRGLGIDSIRLRVQLLQGKMKYKSNKDRGTRLILAFQPKNLIEKNDE